MIPNPVSKVKHVASVGRAHNRTLNTAMQLNKFADEIPSKVINFVEGVLRRPGRKPMVEVDPHPGKTVEGEPSHLTAAGTSGSSRTRPSSSSSSSSSSECEAPTLRPAVPTTTKRTPRHNSMSSTGKLALLLQTLLTFLGPDDVASDVQPSHVEDIHRNAGISPEIRHAVPGATLPGALPRQDSARHTTSKLLLRHGTRCITPHSRVDATRTMCQTT